MELGIELGIIFEMEIITTLLNLVFLQVTDFESLIVTSIGTLYLIVIVND